MIALARFISAGAGYFLKKKSRVEKNQQLILERMQPFPGTLSGKSS